MSTISALSSSSVNSEISNVEQNMQAQITPLDNEITTDKAEISAWGNISGAMSSLSQSLSGIKDVSTLNYRAATSSNTSVATATASNNAATGTYNLTNVSLAKSQEIYSNQFSSAGATLSGSAGSMVFTMQNGHSETISVGSGSLSLNSVAAAINKQAGGVQASVIGTSAGARLVLQSSATGSSAAFAVSGTGALAQFDYSPSSAHVGETLAQSAADASLSLNGVPVTSTTNVLGSAVTGVNLTLASSGNAMVSVSSSPGALSNSVQQVTTSLNKAIATISAQTKYVSSSSASSSSSSSSSSSAKSGPLLGNYSATELKNELMTSVSGLAASGVSASEIGLSINSSGTISFNSNSFAAAYASNPTAVQNLVGDLYTSLHTVTASAIGSSSGLSGTTGFISTETTSLNASITSLNDQINQMATIDAEQLTILENEYTVAEAAASSASITQTYLSIFTGSGSSNG
jgi:flagellar hook-associated protein 2